MSFDDLPQDWPTRPLTDSRLIADVLDLVVPERSRIGGSLYILLCDENDRLLQPIAIATPDPAAASAMREEGLGALLSGAEDIVPGGSFIIVLAREDGLSVTEDDELWASAAQSARGAWRLLGIHVITLEGSRPVPLPAATGRRHT